MDEGHCWRAYSQKQFLLVALENGTNVMEDSWGEQVDATVDELTDKSAGFLHIVQDLDKRHMGRTVKLATVATTALPEPRTQKTVRGVHYIPHACQGWPQCTHSSETAFGWPAEKKGGHRNR